MHDVFRREFALIRAEVAGAGPGLGARLRRNCLTLCARPRNHHGGGDVDMLPFLDRSRPDLAPVLERLRREHAAIVLDGGR